MGKFNWKTIEKEHALETYKSLITIALESLKLLVILNGGAIVALLAFLGNVSSKVTSVPKMLWPISLFIGGLFFCSVSYFGAYFTQMRLFNEDIEVTKESHAPVLFLTILFMFSSLILFSIGSFLAAFKFQN